MWFFFHLEMTFPYTGTEHNFELIETKVDEYESSQIYRHEV